MVNLRKKHGVDYGLWPISARIVALNQLKGATCAFEVGAQSSAKTLKSQ